MRNLLRRIRNRLHLIRRKLKFRRLLVNWREAWDASLQHRRGVTLKLRDGTVVHGTDRDDVTGIFCEIFVDECYTPAWFYTPQAGHHILDVGANIGLFSLFLATRAPGSRIAAFEPHPATFQQLAANVSANRLENTIAVHEVAVSRSKGTVAFAGVEGLESGHEAAQLGGQGRQVPSIGLADALAMVDAEQIELLKVDTEGAEVDILCYAPSEVWSRVRRVVVEYHSHDNRARVLQSLTEQGYQCRDVPTPTFEHFLGTLYAWRVDAEAKSGNG